MLKNAILFLLTCSLAFSVPATINYQGKLTDDTGVALDSLYDLTFRIYNVAVGGTPLWTEAHSSITVSKGLFDVLLGSTVSFSTLDFSSNYWLSIEIGTDGEMTPRVPFSAVPYSFYSLVADSIAGHSGGNWEFSVTDFADTTLCTIGRWGIARSGNTAYGASDSTHVNFGVASETGTSGNDYKYCTVGGGILNIAAGENSMVSGGAGNTAGSESSTIGGGIGNSTAGIATTIGGGESNDANGEYVTIAGGYNNTASSDRTTIGGGYANIATITGATIGGGYDNDAAGAYATIAGGWDNSASGVTPTIGGGTENKVNGDHSVIPGGRGNEITGAYSAIPGGYANSLTGNYSYLFGIADSVSIDSTLYVGTPYIYFEQINYESAPESVLTISNGQVRKVATGDITGIDWDTLQAYSDTLHNHNLSLTGDVAGSGTVSGSIATDLAASAVDWDELASAVQDSIHGDWVQLSPTSAQTDPDATPSIHIDRATAAGNLLELEQGGFDRFTISYDGNVDAAGYENIGGYLTIGGYVESGGYGTFDGNLTLLGSSRDIDFDSGTGNITSPTGLDAILDDDNTGTTSELRVLHDGTTDELFIVTEAQYIQIIPRDTEPSGTPSGGLYVNGNATGTDTIYFYDGNDWEPLMSEAMTTGGFILNQYAFEQNADFLIAGKGHIHNTADDDTAFIAREGGANSIAIYARGGSGAGSAAVVAERPTENNRAELANADNGVYGEADGSDETGVKGANIASSGAGFAVGVEGEAIVAGGTNHIGVRGTASGATNNYGVYGVLDVSTYGWVGGTRGMGSDSIGVYGQGPDYGVFGYYDFNNYGYIADGKKKRGVYGRGDSIGVAGLSSNIGMGLTGSGKLGVWAEGMDEGYGIFANSIDDPTIDNFAAIYGNSGYVGDSPSAVSGVWAGYFEGNVTITDSTFFGDADAYIYQDGSDNLMFRDPNANSGTALSLSDLYSGTSLWQDDVSGNYIEPVNRDDDVRIYDDGQDNTALGVYASGQSGGSNYDKAIYATYVDDGTGSGTDFAALTCAITPNSDYSFWAGARCQLNSDGPSDTRAGDFRLGNSGAAGVDSTYDSDDGGIYIAVGTGSRRVLGSPNGIYIDYAQGDGHGVEVNHAQYIAGSPGDGDGVRVNYQNNGDGDGVGINYSSGGSGDGLYVNYTSGTGYSGNFNGASVKMPGMSAGSPMAAGAVYFDTDDNKMYYHNGTGWIAMSGGSDNDWIRSGNLVYTYNTTDSVGMGTTSPEYPLDVYLPAGSAAGTFVRAKSDDNHAGFILDRGATSENAYLQYRTAGGAGDWFVGTIGNTSANSDFAISTDWTQPDGKFYIESATGNVGIGETSPSSKLSVNGSGNSLYKAYIRNDTGTSGSCALFAEQATAPSAIDQHVYGIRGLTTSSLTGGGYYYGVRGDACKSAAESSGRSYGVLGRAGNCTGNYNYGVYGTLTGSNAGAAIVGYDAVNHSGWTGSTGGTYAGYFRGDVYIDGKLTTTGGVDPTYISFTPQASEPMSADGVSDPALWVRSSDNHLMYYDGANHQDLSDPIMGTILNAIKELKAENDALKARIEVLEQN